MPILVKRTGRQQYAPGGNARVKVMVIGGPSAGKTRWSSFFPDPIYLDIEGGLASVADRQVPYAEINNSRDMADALQHLKVECRKPEDQRQYRTVIVDTLDAYQRKLKTEWMETKRVDAFTGWEAWGFLSLNMGTLMTRLLNLDMNVIVAVHYKDKTTRDDDTGRETHEYMLQLSGEIADTAFNDFDLVGWMAEERRVIDGKPQPYRYITFEKNAQKDFLKDRYNVMHGEIPVTFTENDYTEIMSRITSRMDDLEQSEDVGEIPSYTPEPVGNVVAPTATGPSVLPRTAPDLHTMDKAQLQKVAADEGVTTTATGKPLRGNTLKSELIEAITAHRQHPKPAVEHTVKPPTPPAAVQYRENPPAETVNLPEPPAKPQPTIRTEVGRVNPGTGEIITPKPAPAATPEQQFKQLSDAWLKLIDDGAPQDQIDAAEKAANDFDAAHPELTMAAAQELVTKELGAKPIARSEERARVPERQPAAPEPAPSTQGHKYADQNCKMCGKSLAGEPFQPIQLGWIKFRALLCEEHFIERRDAAK